jgi:uncharacterized protein (UPF0147 family)
MMNDIKEALEELNEEFSVPKNVKEKLNHICKCINDADSLELNKILDNLDEISNDINLQPYIRSQLWNITTMLESAKASFEIVK